MDVLSSRGGLARLLSATETAVHALARVHAYCHDVKTHFCFFSAGLRIWKLQSKLSSTLIIAPALSNSPQ